MTRYEYLVEQGILRPDDHQKAIVKRLMRFWEDLEHYDPGPLPEPKEDVAPSFVCVTSGVS